jgi:hypothetical protein
MPHKSSTIEISSMNDGSVGFRLLRADTNWNGMLQYHALALDPGTMPRLDNQQNVMAYGQQITKALCEHKAVNPDLTQFFGLPANVPAILRFLITTTEGEWFRWETLCDDHPVFLAVHHACSVSRVIIGGRFDQDGEYSSFEWPIRMVAFLSASGVTSEGELHAIVDAVTKARKYGLDIRAAVYLGEQDLLDAALKQVKGGNWPGIDVFPIPSNSCDIEDVLKREQPQIVHFFCHGVANAGISWLQFASLNDHDIDAVNGSIPIAIERLEVVMGTIGTVWVTVLNSCASAKSPTSEKEDDAKQVPKLFSMACRLAQTGSPVTVGMAEPVTDEDATLFAQNFYTKAFCLIHAATGTLSVGGLAMIDLGEAVYEARQKLYSRAHGAHVANGSGRWWLPVLYSRERPLKVMLKMKSDEAKPPTVGESTPPPVDETMQTRIDKVAQMLSSLPANAPIALREGLLALLADVPEPLRPNLFGNFNRA